MTIMLPLCFATRGNMVWSNPGAFVSGGQSVYGPEPTTRRTDGGGGWMARIEGLTLKDSDNQRLWESLLLRWNLGDTKIIVPRQGFRLRAGFVVSPVLTVPFSDESTFDDGAEWENDSGGIATLAASIALRATSAQIRLPVGGELRGGEPFTITGSTYGPRLYGIVSVDDIEAAGSPDIGDLVTVTFGPPAREAYSSGADVDFEVPRCTMRAMVDQAEGAYPTYGRSRFAQANMTFVETWT